MYSEHGLDAVIRPVSGLVCQSLIVSSYCRPGSAQAQAASLILRNRSRASTVSMTSPVPRERSPNSVPSSTARMNASLTRTELLAFWYWTEVMSAPPRSMSNPASRRARILSSSLAFVITNSSMSGWSTSRTTILAARRVAPPDLMVPADASAPRMKETGPRRGAAGGEQLLGGADAGEVEAGAGAALEDEALFLVPVQDRVHRVVDGEDEAGRDLLRRRGADVEPDGAVEREVLVHEQPGELVLEDLGVGRRTRSSRGRCRPSCRSSRCGR